MDFWTSRKAQDDESEPSFLQKVTDFVKDEAKDEALSSAVEFLTDGWFTYDGGDDEDEEPQRKKKPEESGTFEERLQRSLAERVVAPEHVHVNVPDDAETLAAALDRAQAGLRREWNAAGRSARILLRSGSHTWAKELLVFCNMTLCFEGLGFQGCQGGRSEGRWWWLQGSQGQAVDMHFSYHHPHRSPGEEVSPSFTWTVTSLGTISSCGCRYRLPST
jgi:hypothetical protein